MHAPEVFLHRAAECESMAKFTRDPKSKATWTRMAERWHRCAEVETRAILAAAHRDSAQQRKSPPGWGRH
jgi:hypothetical protein